MADRRKEADTVEWYSLGNGHIGAFLYDDSKPFSNIYTSNSTEMANKLIDRHNTKLELKRLLLGEPSMDDTGIPTLAPSNGKLNRVGFSKLHIGDN
jgi:hypothetical protein